MVRARARLARLEFGTFTDRFEKLEEALQIITGMLRGERPSLDGRWYRVHDALNVPAPVGRIPIMVGGGGEKKTLRLVAQYADESNLICAPADIPRKLEALAGHCDALGRDRSEITVSYLASVCVAPTHEQAVAELEEFVSGRPAMVAERSRGGLVGTPDEVGERIAALFASGIDGVTVNAPANGHIEGRVSLLGETLAPLIPARPASA
ncbi:MAG TPA: LLM class flavin-dependent oxidoreductase [Microlunatus sp.]|nr:LLM class flavin-dependent oxidoreductase [Microlunatus sp.]